MTQASLPVGVVRFPGTNCDRDVFQAVEMRREGSARWLWHADQFDAKGFRALILPGGFSYGDYLRAGALAARSPAMKSVREAAAYGVPILGICNGFQILCEAGLLPGVLMRNIGRRFIDDWVELAPVAKRLPFARAGSSLGATSSSPSDSLRLPIAHADGRFTIDDDGLKQLQDHNQIWFTYKNNPNGSIANIAGVINRVGNVAALMPHPERAVADWMGGADGRSFFDFVEESK